jgi:hypothetical protein
MSEYCVLGLSFTIRFSPARPHSVPTAPNQVKLSPLDPDLDGPHAIVVKIVIYLLQQNIKSYALVTLIAFEQTQQWSAMVLTLAHDHLAILGLLCIFHYHLLRAP